MNHSYIKILGVAQRKSFGKSCYFLSVQFISVTQLCQALWDSMDCSTPGLPVPSPTPEVYPNSCPLSRWCHPTTSSSVIPFSSCPQSFPASVILEPRKIKSDTVSTVSPSISHEVMGPDAMILFSECWALSQLFHSPLSLSSRSFWVPLHFLP